MWLRSKTVPSGGLRAFPMQLGALGTACKQLVE